MTIRIREDENEIGGFAFIDLGAPAPSPLLSFRRQDAEPRHLGSEGWQPEVAWLAPLSVVEREGGTVVRFGPNVVDRIEELVPIEIVAHDGTSFGVVSWPFITAPPAALGLLAADPVPPPSLTETTKTPVAPLQPVPSPAPAAPEDPPAVPDPEVAPVSTEVAPVSKVRELSPAPTAVVSPRRILWSGLVLVLLLIALGAGIWAYMDRNELQGRFANRETPAPVATTPPPALPAQASMPAARPVPEPPRFSAAELRQRHARLVEGHAEPVAFVSLGETAIASKQGGVAFRAFEEADPVTNSDAAWQLARFYDPRNTEGAYRGVAQPNIYRAAYYYALWSNRSASHADELRGLCDTNASLMARDERLRAICS